MLSSRAGQWLGWCKGSTRKSSCVTAELRQDGNSEGLQEYILLLALSCGTKFPSKQTEQLSHIILITRCIQGENCQSTASQKSACFYEDI